MTERKTALLIGSLLKQVGIRLTKLPSIFLLRNKCKDASAFILLRCAILNAAKSSKHILSYLLFTV